MPEEKFTITCIILKPAGPCYTGNGWDDDIEKACHYSAVHQAQTALKGILPHHKDAVIRCVIQNKSYDYYDGRKFVYSLAGAKFYAFEEAGSQLKRLRTHEK